MSDDQNGCEPAALEETGPTPAEPTTPVAGPIPEEDDVDVIEEIGPPAVGPIDDLVESVRHLGDRLGQKLDALQTLFDREIRAESTREKVVDRLHAELQEYKQDLLLSTLRPVFIDLIQLHDDIGKVAVTAPDTGPEAARLIGLMQGFQQGIEDILYRQGVEPYVVDGDAFDPRRQRAVATVATDDPARGKTVAARLRKGFQAGDRVLRAEIVSVYAYKP